MTNGSRFHPVGLDRDRLTQLVEEEGLAGILLTSPENVFYTTGYTTLPSAGNPILYTLRNRLPFFSYIDPEGKTTLLCWGFSAEGVNFGADEIIGFNDYRGALDAVGSLLQARIDGGRPLGVESTCPRFVVDLIRDRLGDRTPLTDADRLMERLRLIKSSEEIARLTKSLEIAEGSLNELFPLLDVGMSRLELTREARARMVRNGATGISHITMTFGSENPEVAIDEPLREGSLATLDLGAIYEGYCSDNRRYAYAGDLPASLEDRYHTMVGIIDEVGAALIPGTTYKKVFDLGVDLFRRNDIELLGRFSHVGHNIGLETEEEWIDDREDRTVEEGMVIAIEMYSTAETGEQIGDEETYVIEADGPRRISLLPREIRRVE